MIDLTFAGIIGVLTVVIAILVKIIGFPDQIRKIHKRKSTEGISSMFYLLAFASYVLWAMHGFLQEDWVLVIGQGLGIITTGFIVAQIFYYKKK